MKNIEVMVTDDYRTGDKIVTIRIPREAFIDNSMEEVVEKILINFKEGNNAVERD